MEQRMRETELQEAVDKNKERCVGEETRSFLTDNRGVGVVEVILILVVIFTIYMGCK